MDDVPPSYTKGTRYEEVEEVTLFISNKFCNYFVVHHYVVIERVCMKKDYYITYNLRTYRVRKSMIAIVTIASQNDLVFFPQIILNTSYRTSKF